MGSPEIPLQIPPRIPQKYENRILGVFFWYFRGIFRSPGVGGIRTWGWYFWPILGFVGFFVLCSWLVGCQSQMSRTPKCGSGRMWDLGAQGGSAKAPARNNAPGGSAARATRAWRMPSEAPKHCRIQSRRARPKWPLWKHRAAPKMRLVEARIRCAPPKHCYPETPLGSHPTSRGRKKPININNFAGLSQKWVGVKLFMCFPFSWGKRETHKQNSQEISGKGRESPGTVPG